MPGRAHSAYDIETPRLRLIRADRAILAAVFQGDEALAALLDISIPVQWKEQGQRWFTDWRDQDPQGVIGIYLPVLKKTGTLLGNAGFTSRPVAGEVFLFFELAQVYRGFGLATEMVIALVDRVLEDPAIRLVVAQTEAAESEATTVLRKAGFLRAEAAAEAGWRWELRPGSEVNRQFTQ